MSGARRASLPTPKWRLSLTLLILAALTVAAYVLFMQSRTRATTFYGTALEPPVKVGTFALDSVDGRKTLGDWRGKHLLVFFGFTNCPDVCPLTMGRLADVYRELGEPEDVQVVMISVDPVTDTPERVSRYVRNYHPSFVGLTGSTSDIAVAARTFFVGYQQLEEGVGHTDSVALLDPQGRMRFVYSQDKVLRLRDDLERILGGDYEGERVSL